MEPSGRVFHLPVQVQFGFKVTKVRIHLLHLLKNTAMVRQWEQGLLRLMEMDEYVNLVCDQLEILPADMVIHRVTGDGPADLLLGPMWSQRKFEVLNAIDRELEMRQTWQGRRSWFWQTALCHH